MTIFGDSRLGRFGYVIAVLLMLAFDFVKAPVEQHLMKLHDEVAQEMLAPRPLTDGASTEAGKINGREMPFMLKAHEDIVRDLVRSGRKMSKAELKAEIDKRLGQVPPLSVLGMDPNTSAALEVRTLADRRSELAMLFPIMVFAMTAATIVTLLWMVSSRLRDIGWPQSMLWILIAPVFLPKFLQIPLSPLAAQGVGLLFYAGIALLVFVPGAGDGRPPPPMPVQPVAIRRARGRFGRLGVQ